MTMSKHDMTLAMVDEQIERTEESRKKAEAHRLMCDAALKRAVDELKVIDYSLKELRDSRSCLEFDRAVVSAKA